MTQQDDEIVRTPGDCWRVKVRDLPARKGWAESSVALRAMRDPVGNGGVQRALWEKS